MNHMNGRVQDSITGRFLSGDPNIPDPRNTQDYNRYSYVDNNPLTLMDPSGFCASGSVSLTEVVVCGSTDDPLNGDGGSTGGGSPPLPPDAQKQLLEQDLEKSRETCPSIDVCRNESPPANPPDPPQPDSCPKDNPDCMPQKNQNQPSKFNPRLCALVGGIYCQDQPTPTLPCVGSFSFAGREADVAEGSIFVGAIVDSTLNSLDIGPMYEGALGGEGGAVGGAFTQSANAGTYGGFVFAGGSLSAGPLAGVQVGVYMGPHDFGIYFEGHRGPTAGGVGFGFTSCPTK